MKKAVKIFFICLGCFTLGLGTAGIFLPLIPTVPLYLVTAFSFARSSEKLNRWFRSTKLYKKYLESYTQSRSMTLPVKIVMIASLAVSFTLAAIFTWDVTVGGIYLLRFLHPTLFFLLSGYFIFGVKTVKAPPKDPPT